MDTIEQLSLILLVLIVIPSELHFRGVVKVQRLKNILNIFLLYGYALLSDIPYCPA